MPEHMKRVLLSIPEDWLAAFKAQASVDGQSLSEWVRDCCKANLQKEASDRLSTPAGWGGQNKKEKK